MRVARLATLVVVLLLATAGLALWLDHATEVATFDAVKARYRPSEGELLDRHGEVIHRMRIDQHGRRLPWVKLDAVSAAIQRAVIEAEDKRFYQHHGVDWIALAKGLWETASGSSRRGASTLTMQLAAEIDPILKPVAGRRSLRQKWGQVQAARGLEARWSKAEILEAYLNLVSFRGEFAGLPAASRAFFGKAPNGLDWAEAALLAALLRAPNAPADMVAKRACALARNTAMEVDCASIQALAERALASAGRIDAGPRAAPHVAKQLLSRSNPRVVSTLDGPLQRYAAEALQRELGRLAGRNVRDGAVLAVDNTSGEVLAYVGNAGAASSALFVDGVRAPRQAGSTLKPFLYELALERRVLTAASLIDDAPVNIATATGLYVPQNYDKDFKGMVSVRASLGSSLNVPAVKTLGLIGEEAFVSRLRELGFARVREGGEFYGPSLALGSADVTLWELVTAYHTLAAGGAHLPLSLVPRPAPTSQQVVDPDAAFIVSDMLADRAARSLSFGLDNPLATRFWSAAKTGTSKDMRDNWCIGYSARYSVGVWVGNFDGTPMTDVSGVTGAAPLWLAVMNYLHGGASSLAPAPPSGLERREVTIAGVARSEWFLAGTAASSIVAKPASAAAPRIAYPKDGEIISLDPDIPADAQRIVFRTEAYASRLRWRLSRGERASELDGPSWWKPQAGRFELALLDAQGAVIDRVKFEVRGDAVEE